MPCPINWLVAGSALCGRERAPVLFDCPDQHTLSLSTASVLHLQTVEIIECVSEQEAPIVRLTEVMYSVRIKGLVSPYSCDSLGQRIPS